MLILPCVPMEGWPSCARSLLRDAFNGPDISLWQCRENGFLEIKCRCDAKERVQGRGLSCLEATQGAHADACLLGKDGLRHVSGEAHAREALPDFLFYLF